MTMWQKHRWTFAWVFAIFTAAIVLGVLERRGNHYEELVLLIPLAMLMAAPIAYLCIWIDWLAERQRLERSQKARDDAEPQ